MKKYAWILIFLSIFIFKLWAIGLFPMAADEGYYWLWSKHLDISYVDHPPMIAYLNSALTIFPVNELIAIRPDGRRVYAFHPWEKNIARVKPYLYTDVTIRSYLEKLKDRGEDPDDYRSIWYYY